MSDGQEEYEAYCASMGWKKQRPWHLLPSDEQGAWKAVHEVRGDQYSQGYRDATEEMSGYREFTCPECDHSFEEFVEP